MYYQNYEDYMRSVLGYPMKNNYDTYKTGYIENFEKYQMPYQNTNELENYYPEVYKIINPIVCKVCDEYNIPITNDIIENMVEEVYSNVESNKEISVIFNIDNRSNEMYKKNQEFENRQRRPNNLFLRDLIKILILNRLLRRDYYPKRPIY